jgi:DNA-directed RNA polymerase specialized sigma subunit
LTTKNFSRQCKADLEKFWFLSEQKTVFASLEGCNESVFFVVQYGDYHMTEKIFGIPVVRLTEAQKAKVEEVLVRGNKLLKQWASFAGERKYRSFRIAVVNNKIEGNIIHFQYARGIQTCMIPSHLLQAFQRDLPFMQEAHKVIQSDLNNRNVEESIMQNFVLMISKIANRTHKRNPDSGLTLDDFMQEGLVHLIDSIYNWTPWVENKKTELSTFLQVSITRHFWRIINKNRITGALKNSDLKLIRKIRSLEESHTFDEIVQTLDMNLKQRVNINCVSQVYSLDTGYRLGDENSGSMSVFIEDKNTSKFYPSDGDEYSYKNNEDEEYINHIFQKSKLTDIEQEVVRLSMTNNRGWQTEYANSHLNPTTGKPYSRMRISQILQSARAKLQSNYERV